MRIGRFIPGKKSLIYLLTAGIMAFAPIISCSPTKPNQKPIASFTAEPMQGYAPFNTSFNASASSDSDGSISAYRWDFETDGTIDEHSVQPNHTFEDEGTYTVTLEVEDNDGAIDTTSLEIRVSDGSPVININNFNFNEDEQYILNLNTEVSSQLYSLDQLVMLFSSPNLNINLNGSQAEITNTTEDWNGTTYFDLSVTDPDSRTTSKRVNIVVNPQSDISGYLEHNLTGNLIPGIEVIYKDQTTTTDSGGRFNLQIPSTADTLRILSGGIYYGYKPRLNLGGADLEMGRIPMAIVYVDPVTEEDLLTFTKKYMLGGRWEDSNLPLKEFIEGAPTQAYGDSIWSGIEIWEFLANQKLPEGRKLNLNERVFSDLLSDVLAEYSATGPAYMYWSGGTFNKAIINFNPNYSINRTLSRTSAHEIGHAWGFLHSPYEFHIMYGGNVSPSTMAFQPTDFEVESFLMKYTLKQGSLKDYHK